MNTREASQKGGEARIRLYGNPGTPRGRRLGGIRSLKTHVRNKTAFKRLQRPQPPKHSIQLAELMGIVAGDGHVGEYQVSITTNSLTDLEHAKYTKRLLEKLFGVQVSLRFRRRQNACVVVVSSKEIGRFLVMKGMVRGHKIRGELCMPLWIRSKKTYRRAFVRGLFDTDGSVYVDVHRIRGRTYKNLGMEFTNHCVLLLADFKEALESLGLHPTQKTKYAVFLRREKDIQRYFGVVGSSNPKHLRKVQQYFSSRGRRSARNW